MAPNKWRYGALKLTVFFLFMLVARSYKSNSKYGK